MCRHSRSSKIMTLPLPDYTPEEIRATAQRAIECRDSAKALRKDLDHRNVKEGRAALNDCVGEIRDLIEFFNRKKQEAASNMKLLSNLQKDLEELGWGLHDQLQFLKKMAPVDSPPSITPLKP